VKAAVQSRLLGEPDAMTKIGLMGCGVVADYGHLPAIKNCSDLELFAVYDPDEESRERARHKFGVPYAYGDEAAFFNSGIEAVTITSPAPCHLENVLSAARYGLPVLCEKPLAPDDEEAQRMIDAMAAAGAPLYAAFCYRFSEVALRIRALAQSKAIGEIRSLRLIYNWDLHGKFWVDAGGKLVPQRRREERMQEGGPMIDCGTHQIDLAHFWLGSPVVDFCARGAWVDEHEAPDHIWLQMDHLSGAHTMIEMSYSYHHTTAAKRREFDYELIGTQGVIRYDREARNFTMENAAGSHRLPFGEEKNFVGLYREFASALQRGHSELLTSGRDGMRVVQIAREATNQAIRHRESLRLRA
jgi:predicted dehydrogenase